MTTTYLQDHNRLFDSLSEVLHRDLAHLSTEANGGRSILFVYPPHDEEQYIEEARRRLTNGYAFIDLRQVFVEFINAKGIDKFRKLYKNMGTEVFVSQNYPQGTFYYSLLQKITEAADKGLSPVLVHTGVIYGMGFSNHNIMEDPAVMKFKKPLVFFYPATQRGDTIYFLGLQPASKYRCVVVM